MHVFHALPAQLSLSSLICWMISVYDSFRDGGKHGLRNVDDVNKEMGKNKL